MLHRIIEENLLMAERRWLRTETQGKSSRNSLTVFKFKRRALAAGPGRLILRLLQLWDGGGTSCAVGRCDKQTCEDKRMLFDSEEALLGSEPARHAAQNGGAESDQS